MVRKAVRKRTRRSENKERFLVLRVKRKSEYEVYILAPAALGHPVKNKQLDCLIDEYKRFAPYEDDERVDIDFAVFVDSNAALLRICSQNHPHPPQK